VIELDHVMVESGNSDGTRSSSPVESRSLGTFLGVFTPSILTILGVILVHAAGSFAGQLLETVEA
jgi:hypothetical protein